MLRPIQTEDHDELSLITMNLPTLDRNLFPALLQVLEQIETKPKTRIVILTGRLHVFSAGAELREVIGLETPVAVDRFTSIPLRIVELLSRWNKVSVAAINGHCLGGALEIALACDLRFCVDSLPGNADGAFLGFPETRLGLVPGIGGNYLATRVIGFAHALELILTSRLINAEQALRIGLVHRVFAREGFGERSMSEAREIVSELRTPICWIRKAVFGSTYEEDLAKAQRSEVEIFRESCLRPETKESIRQALLINRNRFQRAS